MQIWAEIVLVWALANYVARDDRAGHTAFAAMSKEEVKAFRLNSLVRGIAVGLTTWALASGSSGTGRFALMGVTGGLTVALRLCRERLAAHKFAAELELGANALFLALSGVIIGASRLAITPIVVLPVSQGKVAAACWLGAASLFVVGGGTHIVRGMLDRAGSLTAAVSETEYNRGRVIGNLERVLMLVLVMVSSYEALGLLVAAKGLIRANELANRDVAEYFILGSLCSIAVALLVGIPLRAVVVELWR